MYIHAEIPQEANTDHFTMVFPLLCLNTQAALSLNKEISKQQFYSVGLEEKLPCKIFSPARRGLLYGCAGASTQYMQHVSAIYPIKIGIPTFVMPAYME